MSGCDGLSPFDFSLHPLTISGVHHMIVPLLGKSVLETLVMVVVTDQ
jgi:hypothetical protein